MSNAPNYLRLYRKRSPLTQSDIAFLLRLPDVTNISRYEKGQRMANIETLLTYHLLFNVPIEYFFEQDSMIVLKNLLEQIDELTKILWKNGVEANNTSRIKFLEQVINRLTT